MNQTGSHQEPATKFKGHGTQVRRQLESTEPDSVDEYMRHVGRTLYEIIRDWVREQKPQANGINEPELKKTDAVEGGIA